MGRRSSGSATTAPKGRATARRGGAGGGRQLLTPTVQWLLAIIVGVLVIVAVLYALRDTRSTGGGAHPADAPATEISTTTLGA